MPKKRVKKNKNALAANEPPKEAVKAPEELDLEEEEDGVEEGFTYHSKEEEAQEDADQEFSELSEEHTSQDKGTEFWNDTMHTAWTIVRSVAVALVCLLNKIRFPIISQPQVLVPSSHTHEIARLKSILPTASGSSGAYGGGGRGGGSSGAYGGGGRGSRGAAARPVRSSQDERMPDGF